MKPNKYALCLDVFTGLYNRNFSEEIIRGKNEIPCVENFTVLILDIDGLKRLNDGYGHTAGDEASHIMKKVGSYGNIAEAFKESFYLG